MGRPAKSLEELQLHGAPKSHACARPKRSKRRRSWAGLRSPQAHLPEECRPLFKAIVKQLKRRRTATAGDSEAIALYCRTHLQFQQASREVETLGLIVEETRVSKAGIPYTIKALNPAQKIAASLADRLQEMLRDMGLTGRDRAKVGEAKQLPKESEALPGTVGFYLQNKTAPLPAELPEIEIENTPEVQIEYKIQRGQDAESDE
jgi:P27 family predicted phage terminase small subunit